MSPPANTFSTVLTPGYRLGDYDVESILGHGGFGITYLARDVKLGTRVAIKEYFPQMWAERQLDMSLKSSPNTRSDYAIGLEQFLEEAQALGRFKHNNIVRVLRFLEENNTAYMVMEYEEGESLSHLLAQRGGRLEESEAMQYMLPILNGLHAVHQEGLLHLDIKPENIYLRKDGRPMLLDFGSVRQQSKVMERGGPQAMTPAYAALEQYPDHGEAGPWTDVYSFGATMYRCMTGQQPIDALARHDTIKQYRPDPLPAAVTFDGPRYANFICECIDWAMAIFPGRRPQTAIELQQGLMGAGAPASAKPPPRKSINTDAVLRTAPSRTEDDDEPDAKKKLDTWKLTQVAIIGVIVLGVIGAGITLLLDANRSAQLHVDTELAQSGTDTGAQAVQEAAATTSTITAAPEATLREYTPPKTAQLELKGHASSINAAIFVDQTHVATGTDKGDLRLWDIEKGKLVYRVKTRQRSIHSLAISPDHKWLASGGDTGDIHLLDPATGKTQHRMREHNYAVYAMAFSPDGRRLVTGGKGKILVVWDMATRKPLKIDTDFDTAILSVAFSPSGEWFAVGTGSGKVRVFSTETGEFTSGFRANPNFVSALAVSRDGQWLLSGGPKGQLKLKNLERQEFHQTLAGAPDTTMATVFSPDGRWVWAAGKDGALVLLDLNNHRFERIRAHGSQIQALALDGNGTRLLTAGKDGIARIWQ